MIINLSRFSTALLIVDVQEKLFPLVERYVEVRGEMEKVIRGFQILQIPIYVSEQYPRGLGETIPDIKNLLGPAQFYLSKTTFSCMGDKTIEDILLSTGISQWVLIGIEAHVCILQTAKGLLEAGKEVVVLNDAISSRSIYDYSTAIAEMRDMGIRITSSETALFELMHDAKAPEFKAISELIKS